MAHGKTLNDLLLDTLKEEIATDEKLTGLALEDANRKAA
jgi:ferritin-like metal-binding protein YciE